ncbi:MAG: hypothetical protein NBV65_02100 [Burkholderiaceae bacterium]|nr:hypothetical protein [Burkholderiaceae bacterium]
MANAWEEATIVSDPTIKGQDEQGRAYVGVGKIERDPDQSPAKPTGGAIPKGMPRRSYNAALESIRSTASGLTFGFADELEAMLRTGQISGEEYIALRDQLRGQQEAFGNEYPLAKTGLEIAGGIALPLGVFAKGLGQGATATNSLLKTVGIGAGAGGIAGGITGAGEAQGIGDIGKAAATSGVAGVILGGAIPPLAGFVGKTGRNIGNSFGLGDQSDVAMRLIEDRMMKDGLSPDQIARNLNELRRLGVPNPTLADQGKSLSDLGYSAYVVPSKAKGATEGFLEGRYIEQPNELVRGLTQKAGLPANVDKFQFMNDLAESQRKAANAAYPKAYSKDISAVPFRQFVDREAIQQAYQEAVKRADAQGRKLPPFEQIRNAQFISTEILHQLKIGLDRMVEKEIDSFGKMSSYGRDISKLREDFNNLIKQQNPDYAKANKRFADSARIQSAFENGTNYQKLSETELLAKLKNMTQAERESFRLGMIADINQRLDNFKGGDFTRQIFKSAKQKSLLRYAFDNEKSYQDFVKYVEALDKQSRTMKNVLGNSKTAERLAMNDDANLFVDSISDVARGNTLSTALNLTKRVVARAKGISEESSAELQKRLFSSDPAEQKAIIDELRRRAQNRRPSMMPPTSGALGTVGGLLGN